MLRIINGQENVKLLEVNKEMTLKDIYLKTGGKNRPVLIQVGGPLGKLYKDYDIKFKIERLQADFYEDSIAFFESQFCPVDYMRFMVRFLIRELKIHNETIKEIHDLIIDMTRNKSSLPKLNYLQVLIQEDSVSKGELFLKRNVAYILEHFEVEVLEHIEGYCRESICRSLFDAQCINACPSHIHIPGFVALMKANRIDEAYQLMRKENPLSSICGAVCARPCELKCRRGEITSTVGVRALQRFIALHALESNNYEEKVLPKNHKRIGIIGAGPAGLTAAYFLQKTGYEVHVYEKEKHGGGTLAYGVPAYRLPNHVIQKEIESIENIGVSMHYGRFIDKSAYENLKETHDAVILATGTTKGRTLPLSHNHLLSGVDFLKQVRLNNEINIGKRVVVVGGGDVAMDCARTARRLGADVYLVSLEDLNQLPASIEEIKGAQEEQVYFLNGWQINEINDDHLMMKACLSVYDEAGKFSPVFGKDQLELKDIDTLITCIGQVPELEFLESDYIKSNGFINAEQYKVDDKLYAIGDVLKATIAIDAISQGKKVAQLVDRDLGGQGLFEGEDIDIPSKTLNIRLFDMDLKEEQLKNTHERLTGFDQVSQPYSLDEALYESERCMRCDRNSKQVLQLGRNI